VHYGRCGIPNPDTHVVAPCNAGMFTWLADGNLQWPGLLVLGFIAFLMGYVVLRSLPRRS
jgi:hypothetical protein